MPAPPSPDGPPGVALGVDVGGTNTKLALLDPSGRIAAFEAVSTDSLGEPPEAVAAFRAFADRALAASGLEGPVSAGVAVPGVLNTLTGHLVYVANLPSWCDFPLRKALRAAFEGPVAVVNDANAAAVAEHSRRNLGRRSLALLTLGTGIGCGVVLRGRPYGGDHGCGFEVGHTPVDFTDEARTCGCGRPGHLEAYAGAAGVVRTARGLIDGRGEPPALAVARGGEPLSPEHVFAAAERGEPLCLEVVAETARRVGLAAATLIQTLDPTVILLGGAMTFGGADSPVGRGFLRSVRQTAARYSLEVVAEQVEIDFAELGNDAGVCGAAELSRMG